MTKLRSVSDIPWQAVPVDSLGNRDFSPHETRKARKHDEKQRQGIEPLTRVYGQYMQYINYFLGELSTHRIGTQVQVDITGSPSRKVDTGALTRRLQRDLTAIQKRMNWANKQFVVDHELPDFAKEKVLDLVEDLKIRLEGGVGTYQRGVFLQQTFPRLYEAAKKLADENIWPKWSEQSNYHIGTYPLLIGTDRLSREYRGVRQAGPDNHAEGTREEFAVYPLHIVEAELNEVQRRITRDAERLENSQDAFAIFKELTEDLQALRKTWYGLSPSDGAQPRKQKQLIRTEIKMVNLIDPRTMDSGAPKYVWGSQLFDKIVTDIAIYKLAQQVKMVARSGGIGGLQRWLDQVEENPSIILTPSIVRTKPAPLPPPPAPAPPVSQKVESYMLPGLQRAQLQGLDEKTINDPAFMTQFQRFLGMPGIQSYSSPQGSWVGHYQFWLQNPNFRGLDVLGNVAAGNSISFVQVQGVTMFSLQVAIRGFIQQADPTINVGPRAQAFSNDMTNKWMQIVNMDAQGLNAEIKKLVDSYMLRVEARGNLQRFADVLKHENPPMYTELVGFNSYYLQLSRSMEQPAGKVKAPAPLGDKDYSRLIEILNTVFITIQMDGVKRMQIDPNGTLLDKKYEILPIPPLIPLDVDEFADMKAPIPPMPPAPPPVPPPAPPQVEEEPPEEEPIAVHMKAKAVTVKKRRQKEKPKKHAWRALVLGPAAEQMVISMHFDGNKTNTEIIEQLRKEKGMKRRTEATLLRVVEETITIEQALRTSAPAEPLAATGTSSAPPAFGHYDETVAPMIQSHFESMIGKVPLFGRAVEFISNIGTEESSTISIKYGTLASEMYEGSEFGMSLEEIIDAVNGLMEGAGMKERHTEEELRAYFARELQRTDTSVTITVPAGSEVRITPPLPPLPPPEPPEPSDNNDDSWNESPEPPDDQIPPAPEPEEGTMPDPFGNTSA